MKGKFFLLCSVFFGLGSKNVLAQPAWPLIKSHAKFHIPDTQFHEPEILSLHVGGWEDGLYITRDGNHIFSTYLPIDAFSWISDFAPCINFRPYYRGPLLDIDTLSNPWNCPNYMQSDIVKSERHNPSFNFPAWQSSNLKKAVTFEGAACGILKNKDSFDVFICTRDTGIGRMELYMMRNVSTNPDFAKAQVILSSASFEDNPHIERLENGHLLLLFDRDRYIYYSLSQDDGLSWQDPVLITKVLNDQSPYDVQPHLWNDGHSWWVYFCANNPSGYRCIYRSRQLVKNNWNSWASPELVVEPIGIEGNYGNVIAVGEPSVTETGDLYFVCVYGNTLQSDTTDVFDCDPWVLKRKIPLNVTDKQINKTIDYRIFPNPTETDVYFDLMHSNEKIWIKLFTSDGLQKLAQPLQQNEPVILEGLPTGVYHYTLYSLGREISSGKILKK